MKSDVQVHFGRPLTADDMLDLVCRLVFLDLPTDIIERATTLQEAKESYRVFNKLVGHLVRQGGRRP